MNRWELSQMKDGIAASLKTATDKLNDLYLNSASTTEDRNAQKTIVQDLTERLEGISAQIKAYDDEQKPSSSISVEDKIMNAKASLIRNTWRISP